MEVWAKREDLNSGMAYGGNKTRKLEYLAQDALNQGCDTPRCSHIRGHQNVHQPLLM